MKYFIFLFLPCVAFTGCQVDRSTNSRITYSAYQPVLADRGSLDKVTFGPARMKSTTGKIYAIGSYVFINEIDEGYHIMDNSDPASPKKVGFLSVVASHDAVIRNNIMYSDNATDLISIDISDITKPVVVGRVPDVFPEALPPDDLPVAPEFSVKNKPANTVVIKWRRG